MRVAQLCHHDVRNDFPPLRTANASAIQHLPTQLTTFVGRGAQMDEICGILAENRLVTMTGAGGAGKTRLAIEVAGRMTSDFPDGVWYIDLAPISYPEVVPVAVARALGLPDQPGRSITDTLLRYVRDRPHWHAVIPPAHDGGRMGPLRRPRAFSKLCLWLCGPALTLRKAITTGLWRTRMTG
jgi:hypothetical protein